MTDKQHEAVRLIRAIADCVQTHPQLSEDEPGGYCTEADQLMDEAAALLRVWSVDIERKDALLRQALWNLECDEGWVAQVRLVHAIKEELQ